MSQHLQRANLIFGALVMFVLITTGASLASAAEKLQVVPTEKVCMVTNMVFPRTQIPVVHAGKTYYGCCENCKQTLSTDPASRTAVDPVSGKSVDKSLAVIAARDDGSVVYFESRKTLAAYMKKGSTRN